jgi:hypothetical protein
VLGQNGTTVHLFHRYWDAVGGSHPWTDFGSPSGVTLATTGVGATAVAVGEIDFFVSNGTNVYHGWCTGTCGSASWSSWGNGGAIVGAPEASSSDSLHFDLMHKYWANGAYVGWLTEGRPGTYTLAGSPGVVGKGYGRTSVGALGTTGDLWDIALSGQTWGSWSSVAANLLGPPDYSSW